MEEEQGAGGMISQIPGSVPDQTRTTIGGVKLKTLHNENKNFEGRFQVTREELRKRHERPPRFFLGLLSGVHGQAPGAMERPGRGTSYQYFNNVPEVLSGLYGQPTILRPIPSGKGILAPIFSLFLLGEAKC